MEEKIIVIEQRILNLQAFASKDKSRENITGIYFDKISDTEIKAVATCGHSLAIATIVNPYDVYKDLVGKICVFKLIEKIAGNLIKVAVSFIDGQFPDYKAVLIPDDKYNAAFGINLELLDKLKKVSNDKHYRLDMAMELDQDGKPKELPQLTYKPMKVTFADKDTEVIIMPVKISMI